MHRFQRQEISRNTISGLDLIIIKISDIAERTIYTDKIIIVIWERTC